MTSAPYFGIMACIWPLSSHLSTTHADDAVGRWPAFALCLIILPVPALLLHDLRTSCISCLTSTILRTARVWLLYNECVKLSQVH